MTALSADANRPSVGQGIMIDVPMEDNVKVWKGGLVGLNAAGYAIPMDSAATTIQCAGVADEPVDNTLSGHTQGGKKVRVMCNRYWRFAASSITQAMVGDEMLAIDDNTVDETSANGATIGRLVKFESVTLGWVFVPGLMSAPLSI